MAIDEKKEKTEAAEAAPKTRKIRLFKDNNKYKDPVFVAINGKSYMIERGTEVAVPDFVADFINESLDQDQAAFEYMTEQATKYKKAKEALE